MTQPKLIAPRPHHGRPTVPASQLPAHSQSQQCSLPSADDFEELRRAHADLTAQVSLLEKRQNAEEERMMAYSVRNSALNSSIAVQRCLLFARARAMTILRTGSLELGLRPVDLVAANTIVQVLLKSQPSDCSLSEFCLLVSRLHRQTAITCRFLPSPFYSLYPSVARTSRLSILFDSYKDMCDALQIDAHAREVGVYKERRDTSRSLRAVQVLGVQVVTSDERKLLLGHSRVPGPYTAAFLQQAPPRWTQRAWESGFVFKIGNSSTVIPPTDVDRSAQPSPANGGTDFNATPPLEDQFGIFWERMKGAQVIGQGPENVPGLLRTYFPAVILRTNRLTSSAQSIFNSRFQDRYPREYMTSSEPK